MSVAVVRSLAFHNILIKSNFIIRTTIAKTHWSKLQKFYACTSAKWIERASANFLECVVSGSPLTRLFQRLCCACSLPTSHYEIDTTIPAFQNPILLFFFPFPKTRCKISKWLQIVITYYLWYITLHFYGKMRERIPRNGSVIMHPQQQPKPLWFGRSQPIMCVRFHQQNQWKIYKISCLSFRKFDFHWFLHWKWCHESGITFCKGDRTRCRPQSKSRNHSKMLIVLFSLTLQLSRQE